MMAAKAPFDFWSNDGSVLPLALRLQKAGHPVRFYVKGKEAKLTGKGLVPFWDGEAARKGAVIFFDGVGQGEVGAAFRKKGYAVIGGNPYDKVLEHDRPAGVKIVKAAGLTVPTTQPFTAIKDAVAFLEKQSGGDWFVKVSGDQAESLTFDAAPEDMIRYLTWYESKAKKIDPFELQRKVSGTEVSINGWFDGQKFVRPFDLTLEEKRFLNHNLGPRTGAEGSLVWLANDEALAKRTLLKIEGALRREKYVGPIDINSLVSEAGDPQFLEFTARLGFDASHTWMHLFDHTLGEQLDAFAHGALTEWSPAGIAPYAMTVRVSVPPYPTWDPAILKKIVGLPLDKAILSNPMIDPMDVMQGPDGPVCAGDSGIVCIVTAMGHKLRTMREDDLLPTAMGLKIPNRQLRTHIVRRGEKDLAALGALGLSGLPSHDHKQTKKEEAA